MKKNVYKLSASVTIVDKYLFCIHIVTWKKKITNNFIKKKGYIFCWIAVLYYNKNFAPKQDGHRLNI